MIIRLETKIEDLELTSSRTRILNAFTYHAGHLNLNTVADLVNANPLDLYRIKNVGTYSWLQLQKAMHPFQMKLVIRTTESSGFVNAKWVRSKLRASEIKMDDAIGARERRMLRQLNDHFVVSQQMFEDAMNRFIREFERRVLPNGAVHASAVEAAKVQYLEDLKSKRASA